METNTRAKRARTKSPITAPDPVRLDENGDLRLEVGNKEWTSGSMQKFLVCSRSLARCSDPFRAMIYGGFAESKPKDANQDWVI